MADSESMMWFSAKQSALDFTPPETVCELIESVAASAGLVATAKPRKDHRGFHKGQYHCVFDAADATRGVQVELLPHIIKLPSGSELIITYSKQFREWMNL